MEQPITIHKTQKESAKQDESMRGKSLALRGVFLFVRHGARTPLHQFQSKKFPIPDWTSSRVLYEIDESKIEFNSTPVQVPKHHNLCSTNQLGILTPNGQRSCFRLGQRIRATYGKDEDILPEVYSPSAIKIKSSAIPRNILSTKCFLAGLYGKDHFRNNPAIIEISEYWREILYPNVMLFERSEKNSVGLKPDGLNEEEVLRLRNVICKELNVSHLVDCLAPGDRDPVPLYCVRDDFIARQAEGFSVPNFFIKHFKEIDAIALQELKHEYLGAKQRDWESNLCCAVGPVLDRLLGHIADIRGKTKEASPFHVFLTHDSLLVPLMMAFFIQSAEWVPYTCDFGIELYCSTNIAKEDCYLRFIYRGEPIMREPDGLPYTSQSSINNRDSSTRQEGFYYRLENVLRDISPYCCNPKKCKDWYV